MNLRALFSLALIHTMVDAYAQMVTPLWPNLQSHFHLDAWALAALLACWQMATSVSQPLFGYFGDRFSCRWLVALGPAMAIVCLSLIGLAGSPLLLGFLMIVGGLGIGAFHPEAAVGVAEAAGSQPARALSIFVLGGTLGLGLGPLLSGSLVGTFGLSALTWMLLPGVVLLGLLLFLHRPAPHHKSPSENRVHLTDALRGRWLAAGLLLAVATLRVVPVLGVPLALAFLLNQQGVTEAGIGRVQSLYLFSGGIGILVCPWLTRPGREIAAMFWTTLPATAFLALLVFESSWCRYPGLVGAGLLLQGTIPLLIAYSQRLLPKGRRLAASLTLGTSWGLGGLIVAGLQGLFAAVGRVEWMLWAMVPFTLLAAVSACVLPYFEPRGSEDPEPAAGYSGKVSPVRISENDLDQQTTLDVRTGHSDGHASGAGRDSAGHP